MILMGVDVAVQITWNKKIGAGVVTVDGVVVATPNNRRGLTAEFIKAIGCPECQGDYRSLHQLTYIKLICNNCGHEVII